MRPLVLAMLLVPGLAAAQLSEVVPINRTSIRGFNHDGQTSDVALSVNARFAAIRSTNPTLVPGDLPGTLDLFVRDRREKTFVRVDTGGISLGDGGKAIVSDDGRTVVFTRDGALKTAIYRWDAGAPAVRLRENAELLAATKDRRLVLMRDGEDYVYDANGKRTRSLNEYLGRPDATIRARALSPSGRWMAVAADRSLDPADLGPGLFLVDVSAKTATRIVRTADDYEISAVSSDGRYLLVSTGGVTYRYDRVTRTHASIFLDVSGNPVKPGSFRFDADSLKLFVYPWGNDWLARRMNESVGRAVLPTVSGLVLSVSAVGDTVAFLTGRDAATVQVGSGAASTLTRGTEPGFFFTETIAGSRDGRFTILAGYDTAPRIWKYDRETNATTLVATLTVPAQRLSCDAYGRWVTVEDGGVRLLDTTTGRFTPVSMTWDGRHTRGWSAEVSPNGLYVAYVSDDPDVSTSAPMGRHVYLWERRTGIIRLIDRDAAGNFAPWGDFPSFTGDSKAVLFASVAKLAPGGELYPVSSVHRTYRRDIATGKLLGNPYDPNYRADEEDERSIPGRAFSDATGRLVFSNVTRFGADPYNEVYVWDLLTGTSRRVAFGTRLISVSPNGDRLALGDAYGGFGSVFILDSPSGRKLSMGFEGFPGDFLRSEVNTGSSRRVSFQKDGNAYAARYQFPDTP